MIDRFISWLYTRKLFGNRCYEFQEGCPVCEQWKLHDEMFAQQTRDN